MNLFENKEDCCGCAACYNICPRNAIEMKADEFGYIYPLIDEKKCIECGLCKKSCVFQKSEKKLNLPQRAYASQIKEEKLINKSASGGIFAELAKKFIVEGGVVYGAALLSENESLNAKHIRIDKIEEIYKLQGSKYIQSDVSEIYKYVKEDLEKNFHVCKACGHHERISARERIKQIADPGTFVEIDEVMPDKNPLNFPLPAPHVQLHHVPHETPGPAYPFYCINNNLQERFC